MTTSLPLVSQGHRDYVAAVPGVGTDTVLLGTLLPVGNGRHPTVEARPGRQRRHRWVRIERTTGVDGGRSGVGLSSSVETGVDEGKWSQRVEYKGFSYPIQKENSVCTGVNDRQRVYR